jgi:HSP20 family protein
MTTLTLRDPLLTGPLGVFSQFFGPKSSNGTILTGWWPTMDVVESEDEYTVYVDVPGVKAEDVTIELEDQVLTISGARVPTSNVDPVQAERPYGSFVRTLRVPKGVDGDKIAADYNDGVLQLHVPKPASKKVKKIAIGGAATKTIDSSAS